MLMSFKLLKSDSFLLLCIGLKAHESRISQQLFLKIWDHLTQGSPRYDVFRLTYPFFVKNLKNWG